jgi:hypothetical protein
MQLVSLTEQQKQRVFYALCAGVAAVMFLTSKQQDPGVIAAAVVLALVSLYPFYFWLLGYSHGLPLWPVFVVMNGITAALPMVQDPETLDAYNAGQIVTAGMTYAGFIILGSIVWLSLTGGALRPPKQVFMISRNHSVAILFGFVASGILYYANQYAGWIPLPGNTSQIVRGVCVSLNTMGIFVLAFFLGRGMLTTGQGWWLAILTALSAAVMAAGLILATAMVPVAMVFLGYILGSGRIPWKSLVLVFVVVSILHPGKYAMRASYWGGGGVTNIMNLPAYYSEWFGYGIQELGGVTGILTGPKDDSEATSVFERAGTIHMLLRVQKMSPAEVPFLNGITYQGIPQLLVPRFIYSDKGLAHAGNILLTVNYGVQTMEQATGGTSIAWGLVTEAFANYGYLGVAALAVFLALFYAFFSRMSVGVPMTSLRFVVGLLVMGAAVKADTMALFITSQFQAIVGVSFAALLLMRRQSNPLAEEDGAELRQMPDGARLQKVDGNLGPKDYRQQVGPAKWGGFKPPKWAPLSHRKAYELAAARRKAEAATDVVDEKNVDEGRAQRPRQVAVPIQPYYYRSRKA